MISKVFGKNSVSLRLFKILEIFYWQWQKMKKSISQLPTLKKALLGALTLAAQDARFESLGTEHLREAGAP